jgi:hypothetical protein
MADFNGETTIAVMAKATAAAGTSGEVPSIVALRAARENLRALDTLATRLTSAAAIFSLDAFDDPYGAGRCSSARVRSDR